MSIVRNTAYNIAGALAPIALSLILTPVFISIIGLGRYGLLSICWVLLSYLGLLDLGTGRAVAQRIAALKQESQEARNSAFWTSGAVCVLFCVIAAAAVLAATPVILQFLDLDDKGLASELRSALPVLAVALPITMLSGQASGALEGAEHFGAVNAISICSTILVICLPLVVAAWISPNLYLLVIASTFGRFVGLIAYIVAAVLLVPLGAPRFDRRNIRHLLSFGGWSTISNVVGPVMTMFDRFVIGRLINASAVGLYVLPFSLMSQFQVLPSGLTRALFPKIASSTELDSARASREAVLFLNFVLTSALAMVSPLISPFLSLWVGPRIGLAAAPVAYALMIGIWSNSLALVIAVKLQAQAKPRFLAIVHLLEVIPFVVLLYLGVRILGVTGAALSWSVRSVADALIIFRWQRIGILGYPVFVSGLGLVAISAVSLMLPMNSVGHWTAILVLSVFTLWAAWRDRPCSAREIEQRLVSSLRTFGWSR